MAWLRRHPAWFRVWQDMVPGVGGAVCWDRVPGVSAATPPAADPAAAAAPLLPMLPPPTVFAAAAWLGADSYAASLVAASSPGAAPSS